MSTDDETTHLVRRLKREVDELLMQLSLGKAEAADFVETQKEQFGSVVSEMKEKVIAAEAAGAEAGAARVQGLKQRLDELKLQLALGRMETRDAYEEQAGKIGDAIRSVREELKPVEDKIPEALQGAKQSFEEGAESFKTKLETFALNLGAGKTLAEDELKTKKEELKKDLEGLSARLVDAADIAEEGARKLGKDVLGTFSEIRKKLRS